MFVHCRGSARGMACVLCIESHARVGFREPCKGMIFRPILLAGVKALCLQAMP